MGYRGHTSGDASSCNLRVVPDVEVSGGVGWAGWVYPGRFPVEWLGESV